MAGVRFALRRHARDRLWPRFRPPTSQQRRDKTSSPQVSRSPSATAAEIQFSPALWHPIADAGASSPAVTGAIAYGVSLSDCARALADIPPYRARLQPVDGGNGIVFLRDDYKAPLGSLESVLHYMYSAAATRKVIVIGTVSDGARPDQKFVRLARRALEAADRVVFIGPWAAHMLRAAPPSREEAIRAFSSVRQANDYLKATLGPGDLVLLKGTNRKDHLERIVLDRKSPVHCWRDDCGYMEFCSECRFVTVASGPPASWQESDETTAAPHAPGPRERGGSEDALDVVVGLGNPGPEFVDTPHNLGRDAVDRLAARLNAAWTADRDVAVAHARVKSGALLLVKLGSKMNDSGPALRALAQARGFTPADCILIHDDLALPFGSVRVKQRGSAGGHRGIAAILDAFQSDQLRRVKIGAGRPDLTRADMVEYVLGKMPDADRAVAGKAAEEAAERVLLLVEQRVKQPR